MSTRNVVVTSAQDRLIDALIERGRYQNASEVLREGLRLVEEREAALEEVIAGIREGLAQYERGEMLDGETAINAAFENALARRRS